VEEMKFFAIILIFVVLFLLSVIFIFTRFIKKHNTNSECMPYEQRILKKI
jgi:hypothetical protein